MSETPDEAELLEELAASIKGSMATAIPATVLTYDPTTQTATCKPTVSGRWHIPETDTLIPVPLPTVANVPVIFGGITWPLQPGDTVLLVICDRSLDEWKATGQPETVPLDIRRFDLTDAVAIPGLRPSTNPIQASGWHATAKVIEAADLRLGSSAASSPVALATLLSSFFSSLKTWLDTHTHPAPGGATSAPTTPSPAAGNVGAAKVRAE